MINESFLNVLMYVFENYIEDEIKFKKPQEVVKRMMKEGFGRDQAHQAIEWFNSLAEQQNTDVSFVGAFKPGAFRVYSDYEQHKLTDQARAFLFNLEHAQIIDARLREVILHQAFVLEEPIIDTPELQWVTLMSLYGLPDRREQLAILEDLILFHKEGEAH